MVLFIHNLMRSRDRKRAEANTQAMLGVSQAPRSKPIGRPKSKQHATPQQLAFRDYCESGCDVEEAKRLAYG